MHLVGDDVHADGVEPLPAVAGIATRLSRHHGEQAGYHMKLAKPLCDVVFGIARYAFEHEAWYDQLSRYTTAECDLNTLAITL